MKLAILGLGGVGRVIAKTAARKSCFSNIFCADINPGAVDSIIAAIAGKTLQGITLDAASAADLRKLAARSDLLINATLPRYNLQVMEACLAEKCHYMDLACETLIKYPGEPSLSDQLAMNSRFRKARLLALCGIGADPGLSNIFARHLVDKLDTVEEILVRDADLSAPLDGKPALGFSPDTFIGECCSEPPTIFSAGSFKVIEPLAELEQFLFPAPLGPITVYAVSHEEPWTLPRYLKDKGLNRCDFGYGLSEEIYRVLKVLMLLGLDRSDPVKVKGVEVAPRDLVTALLPSPTELAGKMKGISCFGTMVRGKKAGQEIATFMYNQLSQAQAHAMLGELATSVQTGIPAALAAELLATGLIETRGAVPPESLDPRPFIEKLPARGLKIECEDRS